jgi:flagellar FliJ protein
MFRFKLEPVLNFRQMIEERASLAFSEKIRELAKEQKTLDALKERESMVVIRFLRMQKGAFSTADMALHLSHFNYLKEKQVEQEACIGRLTGEVEEKRKELTEAMKKRKIMEILKEKELAQHRKEAAQHEAKALDEMGIIKFGKRSANEKIDHSM